MHAMSRLIHDIDGINDLALEVTKAIVDRNEETGKIDSQDAGPLAVAAALSDFFDIATALAHGQESAVAPRRGEDMGKAPLALS